MATISCSFQFPADSWHKIVSYLDYRDLVSCSQVNKQLYEVSNHNSHWRRLCQEYWLVDKCPENLSWKENFCLWYTDFGRYIHCYAKIKTAWNQITEFMKVNCKLIYENIKAGISEETLDELENKIGFTFPDDLRCSYRIHNGQRLITPGLLGSVETSNHYRSERMLDLETAAETCLNGRSFFPLTFCTNTRVSEFINLTDTNGFPKGNIFYMSWMNDGSVFISATDFAEWLSRYALKLTDNEYPVIGGQPYIFEHEPNCVCTTDYIKVSVSTSFLPELSTINPPFFSHAYRITMSMDKDAPPAESCQLEKRHWCVIDADGRIETVDGAGVVGEFPIMRPGVCFSWISSTTFVTQTGSMRGHFTMRNLKSGTQINIECPLFNFRCFSFVKSNIR